MVIMSGATPVFLKTTDKEHFKITRESLAKVITPLKTALYEQPGNPTGMVYTEQELREIVSFAVEKGFTLFQTRFMKKSCMTAPGTSARLHLVTNATKRSSP